MEISYKQTKQGEFYSILSGEGSAILCHLKHNQSVPLSFLDITIKRKDEIDNALSLEESVFQEGYHTSSAIISNPENGNRLIAPKSRELVRVNYANRIVKKEKYGEFVKGGWVLAKEKDEAFELYDQIKKRPGVLELKAEEVSALVKLKLKLNNKQEESINLLGNQITNEYEYVKQKILECLFLGNISWMKEYYYLVKEMVFKQQKNILEVKNLQDISIPAFLNSTSFDIPEIKSIYLGSIIPAGSMIIEGVPERNCGYKFITPGIISKDYIEATKQIEKREFREKETNEEKEEGKKKIISKEAKFKERGIQIFKPDQEYEEDNY